MQNPRLEVYAVNSGAEAVENMMKYFISHRQDVIRRRTLHDLKKAEQDKKIAAEEKAKKAEEDKAKAADEKAKAAEEKVKKAEEEKNRKHAEREMSILRTIEGIDKHRSSQ